MSRELQEQVCLDVAPSPCPGSCPAPAQQQAGMAGPRLEPRQEASAEPEQVRESLWGGDSPGAWLEVLVGGGVFCSLKGHPGRVGREWWLEEELSLDMMGSWRCRWNHRKWPSRELCCHSCLPGDSECRSLMGCSAAGQFPGQDKAPATPGPAALYGGCSPAQPSGCSPPWDQMPLPLHRAGPWSPESHFQEPLLGQLPARPGHLGTASCPAGVRLAHLQDSGSERAWRSSGCRQLIAATQGGR